MAVTYNHNIWKKCHNKSFLASELFSFANKLDPPNLVLLLPPCLAAGQRRGARSLPAGHGLGPVRVRCSVFRVPAGRGRLAGLLAQPLDR